MNARGHLSSETIDLLLLSALGPQDANEAKAHLDECERCRGRWRELNEDKQNFEQFVFARTLSKIEERAKSEKASFFQRFRLVWLIPAIGVAAAAAVALVGLGQRADDEAYVGIKGQQPTFEVFALRNEDTRFEVKAGAELKAKDRIRFVVNPAGAKYVLIASRDGAGVFTVYHPFGAQASGQVEGTLPAKIELPGSVELDDTEGRERLIAVFSDTPVQASTLEAALKDNPTEPKLGGARIVTWEFVKTP